MQNFFNTLFGNSNSNGIAIVISLISIVVAGIAAWFTVQTSQDERKNTNTWEVYTAWNSEDIRTGRALARAIGKDPKWVTVQKLDDYNTYVSALDLPGPNPNAPVTDAQREARPKDQPLHDLMSFYHQVGLLVKQRQIDKDFAMLLVGPGSSDRWSVLGAIPQFYVNAGQADGSIPYGGMFSFFDSYLQWKKGPQKKLNRKFEQAQEHIRKEKGGSA